MLRKVLIVNDDLDIAHLVEIYLMDLGYTVAIETTGSIGVMRAEREKFDLILLDHNLPGVSGYEICRRLRAKNNKVPILMLTIMVGESERVRCLDAGADDFVLKPFSILELVARIKNLMKRYEETAQVAGRELIRHDDLEIDLQRHQVAIGGKTINLTAKEFSLLSFLAKNPGRVFSRNELVDRVWGFSYDGYDHTVHSHINRLRTKIEPNPAKPMRILTIRNVGYKFHEKVMVS